jgi:hypothetical protein
MTNSMPVPMMNPYRILFARLATCFRSVLATIRDAHLPRGPLPPAIPAYVEVMLYLALLLTFFAFFVAFIELLQTYPVRLFLFSIREALDSISEHFAAGGRFKIERCLQYDPIATLGCLLIRVPQTMTEVGKVFVVKFSAAANHPWEARQNVSVYTNISLYNATNSVVKRVWRVYEALDGERNVIARYVGPVRGGLEAG